MYVGCNARCLVLPPKLWWFHERNGGMQCGKDCQMPVSSRRQQMLYCPFGHWWWRIGTQNTYPFVQRSAWHRHWDDSGTRRLGTVYANGKKNPDNGLLSILHPSITFLANKGHQTCGYATALFAEAWKSNKNGCGCSTKGDAERMIWGLSRMLCLHSNGTHQHVKTAILAVLEHYFLDNHKHVWVLVGVLILLFFCVRYLFRFVSETI
jgi:hypothetical protein